MRKLIAVVAMSFFVLLAVNSSNVFAESPNDKILKKLDQIQNTLDIQVIPKLDQCCAECPECKAGVPKTGQTTSYSPGDDGALQKGVAWPIPRFTDKGDDTVIDNLTGLIWTKDSLQIPNGMLWPDAVAACYELFFAGYDDWRLPNLRELHSLIDYGNHTPALPVDHPFTNVQAGFYWSSTTVLFFPTTDA
jgi:hypothetical protein